MELNYAGIVSNRYKDDNLDGAADVAAILRARGIKVGFDPKGMPRGEKDTIAYDKADCLFVLGGDGTLLKAASAAANHGTPMLGINLGRLGFLTEVELAGVEKAVDEIIADNFYIESRMMMHGRVVKAGKTRLETTALNEIAVIKKDSARMIDIELIINGALADKMPCDGMLISTPTGSTGYALSAGGPIVCPRLECILAVPVCPHTLHSKPIVASPHDTIEIRPMARCGVMLAADGEVQCEVGCEDVIEVKKSTHHAQFIRFNKKYFYPLLRSKFLNWDR